MKKTRLLGAVCAVTFSIGSTTPSTAATLILDGSSNATGVSGISVDGVIYNGTFVNDQTFNDLFSTSNPTFWNVDGVDAAAAAQQIYNLLTANNPVTIAGQNGYDGFTVPYKYDATFDVIVGSGDYQNDKWLDVYSNNVVTKPNYCGDPDPNCSNNHFGYSYVTFMVAPIPIPAAVWLFGSGLLCLVGVARNKKTA